MGFIGKITDTSGNTHPIASSLYGTCDTAKDTAAKVATVPGLDKLYEGLTFKVAFENANDQSNVTLKVNDLPARPLYGRTNDNMVILAPLKWRTGAILSITVQTYQAGSPTPTTFYNYVINDYVYSHDTVVTGVSAHESQPKILVDSVNTFDNGARIEKQETISINGLPANLSDLADDSDHRTVSDAEKASWDAKSNFSGSYNDLTNKPNLATVATSGSYNDLSNKPSIPSVDNTLAVSGAAADSKTTGDAVTSLRSALTNVISTTWTNNYVNTAGTLSPNDNYRASDFIPMSFDGVAKSIYYETWLFTNTAIGLYDEYKHKIRVIAGTTASNTKHTGTIGTNEAKYIRVSTTAEQLANTVLYYSGIAKDCLEDEGIKNKHIADKIISYKKMSFSRHDPNTNLAESVSAGYVKATDGTIVSNDTLVHTDFIPLEAGKKYYARGVNYGMCAYYDENKDYVSACTFTDNLYFVVPVSGVHYGRFTFNSANIFNIGYIFVNDHKPPAYAEEFYANGFKFLANKTVTKENLNYVTHDPFTDYVNHANDEEGYYVNSSGVKTSSSSYVCSDYTELEQDTVYSISNAIGQYCAFYDENYTFLSTIQQSGVLTKYTFTIPENAKYIRVSGQSHGFCITKYAKSVKAKPYGLCQYTIRDATDEIIPTDYKGDDIGVFNKILCIGDSLTAGGFNNDQGISIVDTKGVLYNWPRQLSKLTGCEVTNISTSGITTPGWYEAYGSRDLSGHDCAIIQLGVNDGSFTQEVQTAYTNIFNKLKNENEGIFIFVSTIIRAESYGSDRTYSSALISFVESLNDPHIIILDMNLYTHLINAEAYNAGHLSAYGYWRLARDYKSYVSWVIATNKDLFRFIQFIGTDYTYNGEGN